MSTSNEHVRSYLETICAAQCCLADSISRIGALEKAALYRKLFHGSAALGNANCSQVRNPRTLFLNSLDGLYNLYVPACMTVFD